MFRKVKAYKIMVPIFWATLYTKPSQQWKETRN